jgi:hypothetical protein
MSLGRCRSNLDTEPWRRFSRVASSVRAHRKDRTHEVVRGPPSILQDSYLRGATREPRL